MNGAFFLSCVFLAYCGRGDSFVIGPLRWVHSKAPFPSAQTSHLPCLRSFGQKFSTSSLNSLGPVSFTLTVNPTHETCTHQFTTCGGTNDTTISALLAEINDLKETVNRSENILKTLQNQMYWNEKMGIVAELAHIYKERIASYTLDFPARGKPELKWEDLVVHDKESVEAKLLERACESYSAMDPEIITDVDYFMEVHPVPQTVRPTDSTFFVEAACMKARKFKFRDGDPQKELAGRLLSVIEAHIKDNRIPTGDQLITGPPRLVKQWE